MQAPLSGAHGSPKPRIHLIQAHGTLLAPPVRQHQQRRARHLGGRQRERIGLLAELGPALAVPAVDHEHDGVVAAAHDIDLALEGREGPGGAQVERGDGEGGGVEGLEREAGGGDGGLEAGGGGVAGREMPQQGGLAGAVEADQGGARGVVQPRRGEGGGRRGAVAHPVQVACGG